MGQEHLNFGHMLKTRWLPSKTFKMYVISKLWTRDIFRTVSRIDFKFVK